MNYWQRLWRVQLIGLSALAVFAIILALLFVIEGLIVSPLETDPVDTFLLVLVLTAVYGTLPIVLFGAPVYSALIVSDRFHWSVMAVISVLPGAAMLFLHPGMGVIGMIAGAFVLTLTHKAYSRRVSRE